MARAQITKHCKFLFHSQKFQKTLANGPPLKIENIYRHDQQHVRRFIRNHSTQGRSCPLWTGRRTPIDL